MFDWVTYRLLKILKFSEAKVEQIITIVTTRSVSCYSSDHFSIFRKYFKVIVKTKYLQNLFLKRFVLKIYQNLHTETWCQVGCQDYQLYILYLVLYFNSKSLEANFHTYIQKQRRFSNFWSLQVNDKENKSG